MNLSIFGPGGQIKPEGLPTDAATLYRAFEQVKDSRQARGKRYPLALLLTLIMVGKMAGEKTMSGIVDWIAERKHELKAHLIGPRVFPVQSTYVEALARCSGEEIAQVIAHVLLKARAVQRGQRSQVASQRPSQRRTT